MARESGTMHRMPAETLTALISLGGVTLGGGLSYLVQHTTQRTAARHEQRKIDLARAEGRRGERLVALERFVAAATEAEAVAFNRPERFTAGDDWSASAQPVMDRLWVAERMMRVLFPAVVPEAARAYSTILNRAVWDGMPWDELRDVLEEPRVAFLDAARDALG